jgi:hypothetical protein
MTSPVTEYAVIAAGRGITIQTAALIQNGFSEPADAMDYIRGLGLRECMVVAVSDGVRRFLDGYEQAEINKALRLNG